MTTQKQLDRVRKFSTEDAVRKGLMELEKRDIIELYLQLRFDKQIKTKMKLER